MWVRLRECPQTLGEITVEPFSDMDSRSPITGEVKGNQHDVVTRWHRIGCGPQFIHRAQDGKHWVQFGHTVFPVHVNFLPFG